MKRNIGDIAMWHRKMAVLDRRLEAIRKTYSGESVSVRQLIADQDGNLSQERAAELARRLANIVDELQRPYVYADEIRLGETIQFNMQEMYPGLSSDEIFESFIEDLPSFDMQPALSGTQRQAIEDLVYCILMITSCEAMYEGTFGDVYQLLFETINLQSKKGFFSEDEGFYYQLVNKEFGWKDEAPGKKRSSIKALFSDLDYVYELISGKCAIGLVDEKDLVRCASYEQSENGTPPFQLLDGGSDYENDDRMLADALPGIGYGNVRRYRIAASRGGLSVWGSDTFRWLTFDRKGNVVDEYKWAFGMSDDDRIRAILKGLDYLEIGRLLYGLECAKMRELLGNNSVFDGWDKLDEMDARELIKNGFIRTALNHEERGLSRPWAAYKERASKFFIREWGKGINTNELFDRYRSFRKSFCDEQLPSNEKLKLWDKKELWYPEGFDELVRIAFDILLDEEGYSYIFDDDMFHTTYAYIRETAYQMELALNRREARHG